MDSFAIFVEFFRRSGASADPVSNAQRTNIHLRNEWTRFGVCGVDRTRSIRNCRSDDQSDTQTGTVSISS